MTFSFLLRLSLHSCESPNSLFHTSGQEPRWRLGGRRRGGAWDRHRWARRKGMPVLSWVTLILLPTSEWLWAILGSAIVFFFFSLPLLPVICPCFSIPSLTLFPLPAPDFFLFLSSSHPSACWEGFAGWEGKGWGGWSYSNSAGDQCQAQVLSPWWRLSGKKSEMQKRIKNKEGNPG